MQVYKNFQPLVSVILPTFNRSTLICRAIDSVINQSFKEWELLIVDDGSTDNTFQSIDKYIMNYENIRYMRHSNRKLAITENVGILAASGNYITFIGSDDEYLNEHLKLRIEYIDRNNHLDLIHGGVSIIGDKYVKDKNDLSRLIHLEDCVIGGTFFGKKEVFLNLKGFKNIPYSEDSEFFERVEKIYKTGKVDFNTYVYYRDTPDSICNNLEVQ